MNGASVTSSNHVEVVNLIKSEFNLYLHFTITGIQFMFEFHSSPQRSFSGKMSSTPVSTRLKVITKLKVLRNQIENDKKLKEILDS